MLLYQFLSALLHLSNVSFVAQDDEGHDACALGADAAAAHLKVRLYQSVTKFTQQLDIYFQLNE
jgi:hypothetical protein